MSEAKKCERCCTFYTQFHVKMKIGILDKTKNEFIEPDLCPDCQEELAKWYMSIPNTPRPKQKIGQYPFPTGGFVFNDI